MLLHPFGHGCDAFFEAGFLAIPESIIAFAVIGERDFHFVSRIEMPYVAGQVHRFGDDAGQFVDCERNIGTDVINFIFRRFDVHGFGDQRGDVVDMGESALLLAVAENGHRLAFKKLIHEDADDVAIAVGDVLPLAVDVVGAEDRISKAEHVVGTLEVLLDGQFRDAIRIFGDGGHVFGERSLAGAVDGNGAGKDEAFDVVIDRRVDQVHRADEVVVVVESADEMT